jgi:hypothetical protein
MTNFQLTIQIRAPAPRIGAPIWISRPVRSAFCVLAGVEVSDRYYIVGEIWIGSHNDETPWLPNKEMTKLYYYINVSPATTIDVGRYDCSSYRIDSGSENAHKKCLPYAK